MPDQDPDTVSALEAPEFAAAQFVRWFREVAPYVHAFRGKTFVVAFGGELVQEGALNTLIQDLSLLSALGVRLVLVHGSRPQVNEQLRLKGFTQQFGRGVAPTDKAALECAKEAAGEIRLDIEAAFSQGLPNTPMSGSHIRVISGNFVTARPTGVVDGVDYQHTGLVRKIDVDALKFAIERGSVVLLSPLGFSPTGDAFNLAMEELATSVAVALRAEKLIFLSSGQGVLNDDGSVDTELARVDADALLAALDAGAHACVPLQANIAEWDAVLRNLIRCRRAETDTLPRWRVDGRGRMLAGPAGERLPLTNTERAFFVSLLNAPHQCLPREGFFPEATRDPMDGARRVDVLVSRLRSKARRLNIDLPVLAVRGWGYMLMPQGVPAPHD